MLGSCCQATCNGSLKCRVRSVYTTAPARSHSSLYTEGAGITTLRRQLNHTIIANPRPRPACSSILSDFMVLSVSNFKMAHRSSLYTLGAGITTLRRQLNHTIIANPRPRPACSSILSDFMVLSVSNFKMAHRSSRSILSRSIIILNVFCISKRPCSQFETFTN